MYDPRPYTQIGNAKAHLESFRDEFRHTLGARYDNLISYEDADEITISLEDPNDWFQATAEYTLQHEMLYTIKLVIQLETDYICCDNEECLCGNDLEWILSRETTSAVHDKISETYETAQTILDRVNFGVTVDEIRTSGPYEEDAELVLDLHFYSELEN